MKEDCHTHFHDSHTTLRPKAKSAHSQTQAHSSLPLLPAPSLCHAHTQWFSLLVLFANASNSMPQLWKHARGANWNLWLKPIMLILSLQEQILKQQISDSTKKGIILSRNPIA